jgi:hypothetical protein
MFIEDKRLKITNSKISSQVRNVFLPLSVWNILNLGNVREFPGKKKLKSWEPQGKFEKSNFKTNYLFFMLCKNILKNSFLSEG